MLQPSQARADVPPASEDRLDVLGGSLFAETGSPGVHGRTALFESVIDGLSALITRLREPATEVLRFPPVMTRGHVEKAGYLGSFPHLLGCVCGLVGDDREIHAALARFNGGHDWTGALRASDLVLTPAACYPLYPLAAARGAIPAAGHRFDVASYCFRREATHEIDRLQAFRMREFVCMGSPDEATDFRDRWMARAPAFVESLALPHSFAPASDPFFGRTAKLIAQNQLDQALKFELLIPVRSEDKPTACMSFNCHRDHFGSTFGLSTASGDVAHTACVAFGMDRLALALFATHGLDTARWPQQARESLGL
jgi:seryl-tRNA synthetase